MTKISSLIVIGMIALVSLVPQRADCLPFDIIVPQKVELLSNGLNSGVGLSGWGWIAATDDTLSLSDMQDAVLNASIDDPLVQVGGFGFSNPQNAAPLAPGEVAGHSTPFNGVFNGFLQPGESLHNAVGFWQASFLFPAGYTGTTLLTGTVALGVDTVTFTSLLVFDSFSTNVTIIEGQRLSSSPVPEPATLLLFGAGLIGLIGIRRKIK